MPWWILRVWSLKIQSAEKRCQRCHSVSMTSGNPFPRDWRASMRSWSSLIWRRKGHVSTSLTTIPHHAWRRKKSDPPRPNLSTRKRGAGKERGRDRDNR